VEEEAAWRCMNYHCAAQVIERLIHFASRDAMEITGMGDAIVRRFWEKGFIKSIPDLYQLPYEEIKKMEGFGDKSVAKLQISLEESKKRPLHKLIFGLGIRYIGENSAKILASQVTHIKDMYDFTPEYLLTINDIGPKVAQSVYDYFQNNETKTLIDKLIELGLNVENIKTNVKEQNEGDGKLQGLTFLFTGTLVNLGRNEAKKLVEDAGGNVAGSLSSKVNYLVAGAEAGSKLDKAKKLGTVKIITEEDFFEMLK
jgi:DNA ligase (NAD+)